MASGSIDVAEDCVRFEVFLPSLLAKLAEALPPLIREEDTCYSKEIEKLQLLNVERMHLLEAGQCYRRSLRSFGICSSSSA